MSSSRRESFEDVVAAVRQAGRDGHRISVCSGGHSWAASHPRDGGLLLDVSRIDHCSVDPEHMLAVAGPGKIGSVLAAELGEQGLFFPAGHRRLSPAGRLRLAQPSTGTGV